MNSQRLPTYPRGRFAQLLGDFRGCEFVIQSHQKIQRIFQRQRAIGYRLSLQHSHSRGHSVTWNGRVSKVSLQGSSGLVCTSNLARLHQTFQPVRQCVTARGICRITVGHSVQ